MIVPEPAVFRVDALTITMITGMIVSIIGSIVTGIISIITATRVTNVKEQVTQNTNSVLAVAKDTEAIKGHVNGEKTASQGREAKLQAENILLREIINEKVTAAILASTRARPGRITDPVQDDKR